MFRFFVRRNKTHRFVKKKRGLRILCRRTFFFFLQKQQPQKKTAHLLGGDTEFSDVNETIGFVKNEGCVYLVPWSWNCVDYVAHTCAVPEGRAATENVGDRQEWFKTDLGASLSLSLLLTPPTFLGLASLPPPPPSSSYPLNKAAEKGGERYARGGGDTEEDGRGRPTGHRPSTNTRHTKNFFFFFQTGIYPPPLETRSHGPSHPHEAKKKKKNHLRT